jgi:HTH-type transcriptional regulator, sugar sensing transcriptional regulator
MTDKAIHYLMDKLGFTKAEATVYLCLLGEHPQTGYKLSSTLGKSRSSTYQALKSLENRQIIIRLEGTQHGEYIPVTIEEYMAHKEKEFLAQKAEIIDVFKDIVPAPQQEHIHQILHVDQLFSKVRTMIAEAESTVLVDTDEIPLERIREWLIFKARENVEVVIETPGEKRVEGCTHISLKKITPKDTEWLADWLCLSVDGTQFLISLLNRENGELIHAIWCGNPYISPWVYNGMLHEFAFRAILHTVEEEEDRLRMRQRISEFNERFFKPVRGFIRLQEKLQPLLREVNHG